METREPKSSSSEDRLGTDRQGQTSSRVDLIRRLTTEPIDLAERGNDLGSFERRRKLCI